MHLSDKACLLFAFALSLGACGPSEQQAPVPTNAAAKQEPSAPLAQDPSLPDRLSALLSKETILSSRDVIDRLVDLLQAGKVEEYNRLRRAHRDSYIDMAGFRVRERRSLTLGNLDLKGIDLSRSLFASVTFSGCDLREADFQGSYLASATFYVPRELRNPAEPGEVRQTRLQGANFSRAILNARVVADPDGPASLRANFSWVDLSGAVFDEPRSSIVDRGGDLVRKLNNATLEGYFKSIRGVGAASAGVVIENPLKKADPAAAESWKKLGLDLERAKAMKCVRIDGHFAGADSRESVNLDPDLLLVIGEGFFTHGNVYSLGPILATGQAHFMGDIYSASWVLFADESFPRGTVFASRIMLGPHSKPQQGRAVLSPVALGTFGLAPAAKEDWLRSLLKDLSIEEIYGRIGEQLVKPISPEERWDAKPLSEILGQERFDELVKQRPGLTDLKGVRLEGKFFGAGSIDVLNGKKELVIVIPATFSTHGSVYSAGPIVILGEGSTPWVQQIVSKRWIKQYGRARCSRVVAGE
jgi:hypothetical protein